MNLVVKGSECQIHCRSERLKAKFNRLSSVSAASNRRREWGQYHDLETRSLESRP